MKKHSTLRKIKFSKKTKKTHRTKKNKTKRVFFLNGHNTCNKQHSKKKTYKGGDVANYPPVYGIENRAVLYPISKYGITAGPFDPPALSNGPNGNGPYPGVLYGVYGGNGGGKRSEHKRSEHKRSEHKRSEHKRSQHKRSQHKRSQHKRKMRRSKYHVGGGRQSTFLPQPLVNVTRSLTGGITEMVNGFGGYTNSASLNPLPYNQPIEQNTAYMHTDFPHIAQDYNKADSYVSTNF